MVPRDKVQKELAVSRRTRMPGIATPKRDKTERRRVIGDPQHGLNLHGRISNNTTSYLIATCFKLRLDHREQFAGIRKTRTRWSQNELKRNERDVKHRKISRWSRKIVRRKVASVDAFEARDALIERDALVELCAPDINRDDRRRTVLQQAVCEPACRGSHIEAPPAARIDRKLLKRGREFVAPARDILRQFGDCQLGIVRDRSSCFCDDAT